MAQEVTRKPANSVATNMTEYAKALAVGIAESRANTVVQGGGKPLLRLLTDGEWVFGVENEPVQEGSSWAVNIATLAHGWQCWVLDNPADPNSGRSLKGEVFASMTDPMPAKPPPIENTEFKAARAFEAKCVDGDDAGTEVHYKVNSLGGVKAVWELTAAIQKQCMEDPAHAFPVIRLLVDHYQHKKHGRTYFPIFEIIEWTDTELNASDEGDAPADNGEDAPWDGGSEPETEPEPAPAPAPAQPTRRAAQPATAARKPQKAPLTTAANRAGGKAPVKPVEQPARQGQRRRPGR